jgi:hypothetical protein
MQAKRNKTWHLENRNLLSFFEWEFCDILEIKGQLLLPYSKEEIYLETPNDLFHLPLSNVK